MPLLEAVVAAALEVRRCSPVAEAAARRVLSLPIGPLLANASIGRVVDALRSACASASEATVAA